jgi:asparagine synthase (glutamine-hydrolysing)
MKKSMIDLLNLNPFGLIHKGQLGNVIKGIYYSSLDKNKKYDLKDGAYSTKLISKIDKSLIHNNLIHNNYNNQGIFKFYNRAFRGTIQGYLVIQEYTEAVSPFLDIDFLNYCLKIPLEYRYNHNIYSKWILNKYPKASKYKRGKINGKITEKTYNIFGKTTTLKQFPKKVYRKIFKKNRLNSSKHMNPFDYWYKNNQFVRVFYTDKFNSNINLVQNKKLRKDCEKLFKEGNTLEKSQVLTLLEVIRYYFGGNNAET